MPFGAKICSDVCPRTLSVPQSSQVHSSEKIISAYKYASIFSRPNEGYCLYILSAALQKPFLFLEKIHDAHDSIRAWSCVPNFEESFALSKLNERTRL